MSGIAGLTYRDGRPLAKRDLESAATVLAGRGSGAIGIWSAGSVGLVQGGPHSCKEAQEEDSPFVDPAGRCVITADARIDNRTELMARLGLSGLPVTDRALIILAYEQWGVDCPKMLLGDFAFAIWDHRRRRLFCARDHMGVKPFYYFCSKRVFAFASEARGVLAFPGIPFRLDEARIGDYLASCLDHKTATFFEGIARLAPGHQVLVGSEGLRLQSYWSLKSPAELVLGSNEEYAEAFKAVFSEAVRCRLRNSNPIGSTLSGGLDSSSVACMARTHLQGPGQGPLHTFSAIFNDVPQSDERSYIHAVVDEAKELRPHFVEADRIGPLTEIESMIASQDEPFYAPNLFLHSSLYRSARQAGVHTLLDGYDGDTTISHGFAFLNELARSGRCLRLAREVMGISRNFGRSPWSVLRSKVIPSLVPTHVRLLRQRISGRHWGTVRASCIRETFAARIGLAEKLRAAGDAWLHHARTEKADHHHRLTWGLLTFELEELDRLAARRGVEPRYPFFDTRLIELCLALPPEQKIHEGWTRVVLRRALADLLPRQVQWRGGKANLSHNFSRSLLLYEEKRLDALIVENPQCLAPYMDIPALQRTYHRYRASRGHSEAMTVWKAAALGLWLTRNNGGGHNDTATERIATYS